MALPPSSWVCAEYPEAVTSMSTFQPTLRASLTAPTVSRTTVASTTRSQPAARRRAIWLAKSVAPRL